MEKEKLKQEIINDPTILSNYFGNKEIDENILDILRRNNDDIPNSVYLTVINGNNVLEELLKRHYNPFNIIELRRRTQENIELIDYYFKYGVLFDLTIIPIDKLLEKNDNKTNLELLIYNMDWNDYYLFDYKQEFLSSFIKLFDNGELRKIIVDFINKHIGDYKENILKVLDYVFSKMTDEEILNLLVSDKKYYCLKDDNFRKKIMEIMNVNLVNLLINNFIEIFEKFDNDLLIKLDDDSFILDHLLDSNKLEKHEILYNKIIKLANEKVSFAIVLLGHNILNDTVIDLNKDSIYDYKKVLPNILEKLNDQEFYNNYFKTFILKNKLSVDFLTFRHNNLSILEIILQNEPLSEVKELLEKNGLDRNYLVQLILRANNIEFNSWEILDFAENLIVDYNGQDKKIYDPYLSYSLDPNDQELVDELKELFKNDSDEEVINLVVNSFIYRFFYGCEYTRRDLESIILIKKRYKKFRLQKGYFCGFHQIYNYIEMSSERLNSVPSIIHELTHAIHYYLGKNEIPAEFKNSNFKINEEKYAEFIKIFKQNVIKKMIELEKEKYDYFSFESDKENYVKNHQQKVDDMLSSPIYSAEKVDYLKKNFIIADEFRRYYNDYIIKQLSIRGVKPYFLCIIDIVDALKRGNIADGGIELYRNVEKLGHGSEYYCRYEENPFLEILANYAEIINSEFKDEGLMYLESIVGIELIEILDNYYKNLGYSPTEYRYKVG